MNLATIRDQSHMLKMIEIYEMDEKYWLRSRSGRSCEEGGRETFALSRECGRSCAGPTLPSYGNAAHSKNVCILIDVMRSGKKIGWKTYATLTLRFSWILFRPNIIFRCLYTLWLDSKHQLFIVKFWGFGNLFLEYSFYLLQNQKFCYWSGREYWN